MILGPAVSRAPHGVSTGQIVVQPESFVPDLNGVTCTTFIARRRVGIEMKSSSASLGKSTARAVPRARALRVLPASSRSDGFQKSIFRSVRCPPPHRAAESDQSGACSSAEFPPFPCRRAAPPRAEDGELCSTDGSRQTQVLTGCRLVGLRARSCRAPSSLLLGLVEEVSSSRPRLSTRSHTPRRFCVKAGSVAAMHGPPLVAAPPTYGL
jgi:hypothetical protein